MASLPQAQQFLKPQDERRAPTPGTGRVSEGPAPTFQWQTASRGHERIYLQDDIFVLPSLLLFFFSSSPSKHTENTGASERTATPRWLCPCAFRAAERCDPAIRWPFAQEGLEETRRSGRSLIPVAPVLLCTARRTLRNPSACRLYGQLARKHSKKPLWALQSPQRWAAFSG